MAFRHTLAGVALASTVALLAAGSAQAQPASTGGGGSMAYPDPSKSGQVTIPGNTARDTGSMAYPSSPGGVHTATATPRAKPASKATQAAAATPTAAGAGSTAATPQGEAAARALATAPGSQPVPYVDFSAPAKPATTLHHAKPAAKKPTA